MFIVAPNPSTMDNWQEHVLYCKREKDLPDYIRLAAENSRRKEIVVFRMTELHYVNIKINTQKYVVTDKGEVIPA